MQMLMVMLMAVQSSWWVPAGAIVYKGSGVAFWLLRQKARLQGSWRLYHCNAWLVMAPPVLRVRLYALFGSISVTADGTCFSNWEQIKLTRMACSIQVYANAAGRMMLPLLLAGGGS
jgi:hypothetical protein